MTRSLAALKGLLENAKPPEGHCARCRCRNRTFTITLSEELLDCLRDIVFDEEKAAK